MSNIYDNPEHFGLTLVKSHDVAGSYEFDTVIVLRDRRGQHYVAHDSGCSCPEPFDRVKVPDLVEVASRAEVDKFARDKWGETGRFNLYSDNPDLNDRDEFERHVADLMAFEWQR